MQAMRKPEHYTEETGVRYYSGPTYNASGLRRVIKCMRAQRQAFGSYSRKDAMLFRALWQYRWMP
jgi:hypothetical protein